MNDEYLLPNDWEFVTDDPGVNYIHGRILHACGYEAEIWASNKAFCDKRVQKLIKEHTCGSAAD